MASAVKIVEDLLFTTANRLYNLNLDLRPLETSAAFSTLESGRLTSGVPLEGFELLQRFLAISPQVKYLRLQWIDYTAMLRVRIVPVKQALKLFEHGESVSVTAAVLGLVQTDLMAAGHRATGQWQLFPIIDSLRLGPRPGYAMIQCELWSALGHPDALCPRYSLRSIVERALEHGISFLVGFEIEVVFLSREIHGSEMTFQPVPSCSGQAWSSALPLKDHDTMEVVESILDQLEQCNITIQQFHPETGSGQFEFVMDPQDPLSAVDALVCAREIIATEAAKHSLRATLVPKASAAGTGAHTHISMQPAQPHKSFLAGVLSNLPAITAMTLPNIASYERVSDSSWSGGKNVLCLARHGD